MAHSTSAVFIHLVFSTKLREPLIVSEIENELFSYLSGTLHELACDPLAVNGVPDHVHLLFDLPRTVTIAKVVETVKSHSSKWIKTKGSQFHSFYWQAGYGAFSVSKSQLDIVIRYIRNQKQHHEERGFQDELRTLLNKHDIEFSEDSIWD